VGIGAPPSYKLHIQGNGPSDAIIFLSPASWSSTNDVGTIYFGGDLGNGQYDQTHFIQAGWGNGMTFSDYNHFQFLGSGTNGSNAVVGIGTSKVPSGYALGVNGKVICGEVFVQNYSQWVFPDYVFEPNYKLRSLDELSDYLKENKHLPNIPSIKEVEKEGGISVGDMNLRLLKTVEELTLYVLELNKQLEAQQKQINKLKKK
jgi:hypothetical protein